MRRRRRTEIFLLVKAYAVGLISEKYTGANRVSNASVTKMTQPLYGIFCIGMHSLTVNKATFRINLQHSGKRKALKVAFLLGVNHI